MSRQSGGETAKRKKAHALGLSAETFAAWYLRLCGWRILKRRYKTKVGEIDLVVKKRKTVAFVEVKARKDRLSALQSITPASQKRIARAARVFVAEHPKAGFFTLRFDVVIVRPWAVPERITNAFEAFD